jgi:hypothetical protein
MRFFKRSEKAQNDGKKMKKVGFHWCKKATKPQNNEKIMGFYTCPTDSQVATSEHVTSKASFGLCRL